MVAAVGHDGPLCYATDDAEPAHAADVEQPRVPAQHVADESCHQRGRGPSSFGLHNLVY